jgi:hypothetical protein
LAILASPTTAWARPRRTEAALEGSVELLVIVLAVKVRRRLPESGANPVPTARFVDLVWASTCAVDSKRFVIENGADNCFRSAVCNM